MSLKKIVCAVLLCCMVGNFVTTSFAADSNVTLIVESETSGGGSSGGGSSGGGNSGGGNSGNTGDTDNNEKPNQPDNPAGGQDGWGDDYYLRPGIDVDDAVRQNGYIIGKPEWMFDPNSNLTRAEFATILDRLFVFDDETITKRFKDTVGHWSEDAVCRLASNGIIRGVDLYNFCPDRALKRDEALLMLGRILYTDKYEDTLSWMYLGDHYAKEDLAQILNSGIYTIFETNFDIRATIARDEMIYVVNNIIYPREKEVSATEKYLQSKSVFMDLLRNSDDRYYKDCLKAIDKNYLISNLGGSI